MVSPVTQERQGPPAAIKWKAGSRPTVKELNTINYVWDLLYKNRQFFPLFLSSPFSNRNFPTRSKYNWLLLQGRQVSSTQMRWGEVMSTYKCMVRKSFYHSGWDDTVPDTRQMLNNCQSLSLPPSCLSAPAKLIYHLPWVFPSPSLCSWCSPLLGLKSTYLLSPAQNFPLPGRLPRLSQLGWLLLLRNSIAVCCQPPLSGIYHALP